MIAPVRQGLPVVAPSRHRGLPFAHQRTRRGPVSRNPAPARRFVLRGPPPTKGHPMIMLLWIWLLAAPIVLAGLTLIGTNR
jgi:hypothetical protein